MRDILDGTSNSIMLADGAVRFISENINTGNQGATAVASGASASGAWGALGSKDGGEVIGEFKPASPQRGAKSTESVNNTRDGARRKTGSVFLQDWQFTSEVACMLPRFQCGGKSTLILLACVLLGCGGNNAEIKGRSKVVPVQGTVMYQGAPLAGAVVMFHAEAAELTACGLTYEQGVF